MRHCYLTESHACELVIKDFEIKKRHIAARCWTLACPYSWEISVCRKVLCLPHKRTSFLGLLDRDRGCRCWRGRAPFHLWAGTISVIYLRLPKSSLQHRDKHAYMFNLGIYRGGRRDWAVSQAATLTPAHTTSGSGSCLGSLHAPQCLPWHPEPCVLQGRTETWTFAGCCWLVWSRVVLGHLWSSNGTFQGSSLLALGSGGDQSLPLVEAPGV